jgi:hypothetical protein
VCGDEGLEPGDETSVAAELEQCLDAILDRLQLSFGQALDLALCEIVEGELGERCAAPERERRVQKRERAFRVSVLEGTLAVRGEALEAGCVDLSLGNAQHVARRLCHQHLTRLGPEEAAKVRDVALNGLRGRARRALAPERVDERIYGDDLAPPE